VFALAASELENFATGAIDGGAFTWTTPAGDTVVGTYAGSFAPTSPTAVAFSSPGQITGGTGRFSGASGSIVFSGTGNPVTFDILGSFVATVSLPK